MKKANNLARKECANYNVGKCTGAMFKRIDDKLSVFIDGEFSGKDCVADSGTCSYFNNIVIRGVSDVSR